MPFQLTRTLFIVWGTAINPTFHIVTIIKWSQNHKITKSKGSAISSQGWEFCLIPPVHWQSGTECSSGQVITQQKYEGIIYLWAACLYPQLATPLFVTLNAFNLHMYPSRMVLRIFTLEIINASTEWSHFYINSLPPRIYMVDSVVSKYYPFLSVTTLYYGLYNITLLLLNNRNSSRFCLAIRLHFFSIRFIAFLFGKHSQTSIHNQRPTLEAIHILDSCAWEEIEYL